VATTTSSVFLELQALECSWSRREQQEPRPESRLERPAGSLRLAQSVLRAPPVLLGLLDLQERLVPRGLPVQLGQLDLREQRVQLGPQVQRDRSGSRSSSFPLSATRSSFALE